MNTNKIFVREYLESLTEKNELNVVFGFLLEAMGFKILTTPSENLGLKEYGKDIIAIGKDESGVKKKFYFELKGGQDRHINENSLIKQDGIISSIQDAAFVDYNTIYPNFQNLELVIVIVHNGVLKGNASELLNGFLKKMIKICPETKFMRWGIEELSLKFTNHLFGPYLLSDDSIRKNLNRVLINLDSVQDVTADFKELIKGLLNQQEWSNKRGAIPRSWKLRFKSLKLIGFIIYRESVSHNNLATAEKHIRILLLDYWFWILKNNLEKRKAVHKYFEEVYSLYLYVLTEYGQRTLEIAIKKDGLYYPNGGAYEQIGYTLRTHNYLSNIIFGFNNSLSKSANPNTVEIISLLVTNNSVSRRTLLDIHSLSILDIILFFKNNNRDDLAIQHLKEVFAYIKFAKETSNRFPDPSNNPENLVKYFVNGEKPVFYIDDTSLLLGMLIELTVVLDLPEYFFQIRDFSIKYDIDLALFIPHHGKKSNSLNLIEDTENDLEEQLFSKSVTDGYQLNISLKNNKQEPISFVEFKKNLIDCKDEFSYKYRTDSSGYELIRDLAHFTFKTPYFPDKWRRFL
ncbi:hypothetical protein ERX46_01645 [Brumimicrobium glaciale]|uniref:Uncharacterized protein n=1 Tax=Brumimicrobium glaciale TaxID=200475 RepID=A0A4Q4KR66_9FLAO|nr:hypothetical protein [Brumimicrobium glaciale]RYM35723.1 hypothetical protein ERX46_01645 [Brumimicrobium glaciale]